MKRSTNEKAAIILAVSVILSVTACSAEGVAYVDGNQSGTGFSSSSAATSGTIYEESTLPATVSVTTAATTTKAKETTAVSTTFAVGQFNFKVTSLFLECKNCFILFLQLLINLA